MQSACDNYVSGVMTSTAFLKGTWSLSLPLGSFTCTFMLCMDLSMLEITSISYIFLTPTSQLLILDVNNLNVRIVKLP